MTKKFGQTVLKPTSAFPDCGNGITLGNGVLKNSTPVGKLPDFCVSERLRVVDEAVVKFSFDEVEVGRLSN